MPNINNINIDFTFSPLLILVGLIILAGYAIFIYKYTIPRVSPVFKYFLVALRVTALLLILIVIFEPVVSIKYDEEESPLTYLFVDQSRSIVSSDSTARVGTINKMISELSAESENETRLFMFSGSVDSIKSDEINNINFNKGLTNLNSVLSYLSDQKANIASAVIISDGIITEGSRPIYQAEKLNFPLFTIGVGDTTEKDDININRILKNDFIYAQKPTVISANILNKGFGGNNINVTLSENNKVIAQKNIELSRNGINKIDFEYTPSSAGEKKLSIAAPGLQGEITNANNRNTFFIDVLDNKIKVLIIAGAPSEDLSFVKNSLELDENLEVSSITQISKDKFLGAEDYNTEIDSTDVLFLIGFPAVNTPDGLLNKVAAALRNNKPFFISLAPSVDMSLLKKLEAVLPFSITEVTDEKALVQPDITDVNNSLLKNNSADPIQEWNNLPPVLMYNSGISAKPESEIISKISLSNIPIDLPLILSRVAGRSRSLAVTASNIWRWKLQRNNINLFDNFIANTVKWLKINANQKNVEISTTKKIYNQGEQIKFTAQVYDETFNPFDDAEVKVTIKKNGVSDEVILESAGHGIYEADYQNNITGDYEFSGSAIVGDKSLGRDEGKFSVSETDIEKINTRMDKNLLTNLALAAGGKYYNSSDFEQIFKEINNKKYNKVRKKSYIQETKLWSSEIILAVIILLFSLEWFFRKRAGML